MSDVPVTMPEIQQHLANLTSAKVTVNSEYLQITVHTQFDEKPLAATYVLKSGDRQEFRRQLAAALRSKNGRADNSVGPNVVGTINNQILRRHALNYLTNPKRWHAISLWLGGQRLPNPTW